MLRIRSKTAPRVVRSVRLDVDVAALLDEMVEAYGSTPAYCLEALILRYAPDAIKQANAVKE